MHFEFYFSGLFCGFAGLVGDGLPLGASVGSGALGAGDDCDVFGGLAALLARGASASA